MPQCLLVLHALEGLAPPRARPSSMRSSKPARSIGRCMPAPRWWPPASPRLPPRPPAPGTECRRRAGAAAAGLPHLRHPAWAGLPPEGEAWLREVLAEA
ncbi:hypothetical protein ACFQU2_26745 [Siccirubricoccus deserti]